MLAVPMPMHLGLNYEMYQRGQTRRQEKKMCCCRNIAGTVADFKETRKFGGSFASKGFQ